MKWWRKLLRLKDFLRGRSQSTKSVMNAGKFGLVWIGSVTGVTANQVDGRVDDWDVDNFNSPFAIDANRKGSGWEAIVQAVIDRDPVAAKRVYATGPAILETSRTDTGEIQFFGTSALHFLSLFDRGIFIHGCPAKVIKRIKALSNVNTKVGLWTMSDRWIVGGEYAGWLDVHRRVIRNHLLVGSPKPSCGGCTNVDAYESLPWPGGRCRCSPNDEPLRAANNHAVFAAWNSLAMRVALAQSLKLQVDNYWNRIEGSLDFFHSDNWYGDPPVGNVVWPAGVTNGPIITKRAWLSGFQDMVAQVRAVFTDHPDLRDMSANVGDHGGKFNINGKLHPELARHFWEHSFLKGDGSGYFTQDELLAGMAWVIDNNIREIYVGGRRFTPSTLPIPEYETPDHENLAVMLRYAQSRGVAEKFYLTCFGADEGLLYYGPTVRALK